MQNFEASKKNISNKQAISSANSVYANFNYSLSLIPLHGDGETPKAPTITNWQQPTRFNPLGQGWENANAYGILAGYGLVFIDLDTVSRSNEFKNDYPKLWQTLRIKTAKGYHLYFKTSYTGTKANGLGCDFIGRGAYVVGWNSIINDHKYSRDVGSPTKPITISATQAEQLKFWVESTRRDTPQIDETADKPIRVSSEYQQFKLQSEIEACAYYDYLLNKSAGRNESLFYTACLCRDSGHSQDWTLSALTDHHITAVNEYSRPEPATTRAREARATIKSAYRRPARYLVASEPSQLSNTIREALHADRLNNDKERYQTDALMLLDVLKAQGVAIGESFSYTSARKLSRGILSRHVVFYGLKYLRENSLIEAKNPLTTPNHATSSDVRTNIHTAKCLGGQKRKNINNNKGRSQNLYVMPSNLELSVRLGIRYSRISDEISLQDMTSPKRYRIASYRSFIARRPAKHSKLFLAKRVGTSARTIQRYSVIAGIQRIPTHDIKPIFWGNVDSVPVSADDVPMGLFLSINGVKFPPVKAIALSALKANKSVELWRQGQNYYTLSENRFIEKNTVQDSHITAPVYPTTSEQLPAQAIANPIPSATLAPDLVDNAPTIEAPKVKRNRKTDRAYKDDSKRYKKPLKDFYSEDLANSIYNQVNATQKQVTGDSTSRLSLPMARRIISTCNIKDVRYALHVVTTRDNVINPVALFVTITKYSFNKRGLS